MQLAISGRDDDAQFDTTSEQQVPDAVLKEIRNKFEEHDQDLSELAARVNEVDATVIETGNQVWASNDCAKEAAKHARDISQRWSSID